VLKHSVVKIAEFLHTQHSNKLPSLQLPRRDQALLYSHVDAIFSKLETLKIHKGIIALHNGVSIGHRKHGGCQRVYVAPFPSRRFHDFNRMDFVFFRPPGADAETFHPDPSNVWYGKCLLAFSFILRADDGSRYKFKCVLISTLEEYVCRDDPTPGHGLCLCGAALQFLMWCCIVYQNRADNKMVCSGNWLFKSESRRLYELDAQMPRLYVIPMTSLLGKLSLVQAGNTGTIPYSMRGRAEECYPGGKCDSSEGKGDGSRLYFVNPWTMKWSQII
jgi:hypothetical protein